ncbi:MAG: DJ-1/PfpI family protein [Magnetococcales bacterium]|nr:DJ-1/PfpI family protein [Magnetococcales bacterium]
MQPGFEIGLLLFPGVMQLDLTGPAEVFGAVPEARVHLLWKEMQPVATSRGWRIVPTTTLDACPPLDVICVPGGAGQIDLMDDALILDFLRLQAENARWVTSVCTGSLVLGAAGLLRGYRAACHWASRDQLAWLGALPVAERVVKDRNRLTCGGVTSGIDLALTLVAEIAGDEVARRIQLELEYDPRPPFESGTPDRAGPQLVAQVERDVAARQQRRRVATRLAGTRLGVDLPLRLVDP